MQTRVSNLCFLFQWDEADNVVKVVLWKRDPPKKNQKKLKKGFFKYISVHSQNCLEIIKTHCFNPSPWFRLL